MKGIIRIAFILALATSIGCDFFNTEQEAFGQAQLNGELWTSHASAKENAVSSSNLDVGMIVINTVEARREVLTLPDLFTQSGQEITLREFPVNRVNQEDPFVYYTTQTLGENSLIDQYVIDPNADNFYKITDYSNDKMDGEFKLTVVAVNPSVTEVDTLRFSDGIFSVEL